MRQTVLIAVALIAAAPADASRIVDGFQELETFEGALGATQFDFGSPDPDDGILSGGIVVDAIVGHSGTLAFSGRELVFAVANPIDFSWPAIGGWVRGPAPVTLALSAYNYATEKEEEYRRLTIDSGGSFTPLFTGNGIDPQYLTRAVFSSSEDFLLDDFTLGLPDVLPGIPEPGSWATLIAGFGLVGAAARRRRSIEVGA